MPDDADALGTRLRDPSLPLATEQLPHVGIRAIARKALEFLARRVEAHDGVGCPIREPYFVVRIDPHGVGMRFVAGKLPLPPILTDRVVHADVAGVPLADPQA